MQLQHVKVHSDFSICFTAICPTSKPPAASISACEGSPADGRALDMVLYRRKGRQLVTRQKHIVGITAIDKYTARGNPLCTNSR
ncbi:MAG: hypothetical protein R3C61_05185 [Bacteroidia bacterium]